MTASKLGNYRYIAYKADKDSERAGSSDVTGASGINFPLRLDQAKRPQVQGVFERTITSVNELLRPSRIANRNKEMMENFRVALEAEEYQYDAAEARGYALSEHANLQQALETGQRSLRVRDVQKIIKKIDSKTSVLRFKQLQERKTWKDEFSLSSSTSSDAEDGDLQPSQRQQVKVPEHEQSQTSVGPPPSRPKTRQEASMLVGDLVSHERGLYGYTKAGDLQSSHGQQEEVPENKQSQASVVREEELPIRGDEVVIWADPSRLAEANHGIPAADKSGKDKARKAKKPRKVFLLLRLKSMLLLGLLFKKWVDVMKRAVGWRNSGQR